MYMCVHVLISNIFLKFWAFSILFYYEIDPTNLMNNLVILLVIYHDYNIQTLHYKDSINELHIHQP